MCVVLSVVNVLGVSKLFAGHRCQKDRFILCGKLCGVSVVLCTVLCFEYRRIQFDPISFEGHKTLRR